MAGSAAEDPELIRWVAARVSALRALAAHRGLAPAEATDIRRKVGPETHIWVLLSQTYDAPPPVMARMAALTGCQMELRTWEGWARLFGEAGLADLHHHLSRPPTGPTWWAHLSALRRHEAP